jgi:hypothetical protein
MPWVERGGAHVPWVGRALGRTRQSLCVLGQTWREPSPEGRLRLDPPLRGLMRRRPAPESQLGSDPSFMGQAGLSVGRITSLYYWLGNINTTSSSTMTFTPYSSPRA